MSKEDSKRQAVLDATMKLVSKHGFHGATMSMIIKESGVSAGAIYHHFKGKDEILLELYRELKSKATVAIMDGYDPNAPVRVQIKAFWKQCLQHYLTHPEHSAFVAQFHSSPFILEKQDEADRICNPEIIGCFDKARREMIIKDIPDSVMEVLIHDVTAGLVKQVELGRLALTPELVEVVAESQWQAIRL